MAHRSARLTVCGRQLLVQRVEILGKPVAMVATELGISRTTADKWLRRHRAEGESGLAERSSRPHRSPRALPRAAVETIVAARVETGYGPHRLAYLTGYPRSTIGDALRRAGMSRLDHGDKLTRAPVRYVACHPGALLPQDHKKLGRVPDGGGHRAHGRSGHHASGAGYDHFEVLIDDASRVGVVVQVPDERPASAVAALEQAASFFTTQGVHVERVPTANGGAYRSRAYAAAIEHIGARHKRTRPYRPQTNGKVERLIRTLLGEWAYARPYRSNVERLSALPDWVHFYNRLQGRVCATWSRRPRDS